MGDRPVGTSHDITSPTGSREEPEVEDAFDRMVDEGGDRLSRPLLPLVATGFLGGVDVGVGVLIYLVIDSKTGQPRSSPVLPSPSASSRC